MNARRGLGPIALAGITHPSVARLGVGTSSWCVILRRWIALAGWLAASLRPGAVTAQTLATTPAAPVVRNIELTADSIQIGGRFELRFVLELPEGAVAFLPDSLEAGALESFEPVQWATSPLPEGGRALAVTYPLIAFQTGSLAVPELDVFVAPAAESVSAGLSAADDVVGSWSAFRESPAAAPSARLRSIPEQRIRVASVLALDDVTTQLAPRPPADVSGGDRDWSSTALIALFSVLLVGVAVTSARDWIAAGRAPAAPPPPPDPRTRALEALDTLFDEAPHRDGRIRDFCAAWSDIVRRYVEGLSSEWGPAWTSSELMADLQGRKRSLAVRRALVADGIAEQMHLAERVKFGGLRPDAETAEANWRSVRGWIAESKPSHDVDAAPRPEADG